jgi:hypothetical protein
MNRDDIIRMAREVGFVAYGEDAGEYRIPAPAFHNRLERFAALVAAAEREKWEPVIEAVVREIPNRDHKRGYNAPGHSHNIPGIWDDDNGVLAGKECAWCKAWNTAKDAIRARGQA